MSILQITYNDIINRMRAKEWKWKDEREREKRNVMNQLVFRPLFRMRAGAGRASRGMVSNYFIQDLNLHSLLSRERYLESSIRSNLDSSGTQWPANATFVRKTIIVPSMSCFSFDPE